MGLPVKMKLLVRKLKLKEKFKKMLKMKTGIERVTLKDADVRMKDEIETKVKCKKQCKLIK